MKIAVCVKEVPGANVQLSHDEETKRLERDGDKVLNSYDSHAVEAALELKESGAHGDVEVVAISVGPESSARTVQKALALGADSAVLVSDEAISGSDILATSRVLAAAIGKHGPFDLVLLGQQAADSDCWVLPAVLAELIQAPVATQASSVSIDGDAATVERQTELGYEKLKLTLPAVISVSDAINTPRYPALKAIMGAKKKPMEKPSLADLGIDPSQVGASGSGTIVYSFEPPPSREAGRKVEDDGSAAEQLVGFLAERNLV